MVELVIFDMDGLMLDTERVGLSIWPSLLPGMPQQKMRDSYLDIVGTNRSYTEAYIARHFPGVDPAEIQSRLDEGVQAYIQKHGAPVKPGLVELLHYLEKRNIRRCVATSSARDHAAPLLQKAGLAGYFNGFVYGNEVANSKPEPDIFLAAATKCGAAPKCCMVLEDSRNGILAAAAAGMLPVMVPDLVQPDEALQKLLYARCDSLADVVDVLKGMEAG